MSDPMGLYGGLATGPGAQHFRNMDPRDPKTLPIPADPMVRISGGIKMIVGTAEVGAGYAMAPKSGGGSLVLATHGFDTYQAGWNELVTGVPTRTVTAQVVTRAAKAAGLSDELAYLAGDYADAGIPFGAGMVGMASKGSVRLTGKAAASRSDPPTAPTNAEIRTWYLDQEASIARLNQTWIENGVPASERALRAYSTRSAARSEARRMMSNADDVRMLRARDLEKYGDPDGPSFPQLIEAGRAKGLEGDRLWESIIEGAQKTDPAVNSKFGLKGVGE